MATSNKAPDAATSRDDAERSGGDLANLLIAGVPKAGTTSLFWYLAQHPEICPADEKEVRYFKPLLTEGRELPSLDAYSRHFAHCEGQKYKLEATPSYCYGGERLLEAIQSTLHRPRIIITLRDPVKRLWSAYTFQRTKGNLAGIDSFEDYISACEDQRVSGAEIVAGSHFNGLSIGFYDAFLGGWLDRFGDDVKIVFAEHLAEDPAAVVARICSWLSIDEAIARDFDYEARNETAHARNTTVSRTARIVSKKTEGVLRRAPALQRGLRGVYARVNTGSLGESPDPNTVALIQRRYSAPNRAVAAMLRARGYANLPEWLE
ncbi:MAG: sulfotransferase domain-containing protein [Actinobacteria bacterium]|nr:sulfotransferase domain-containing protein [Actinomycetota bacterium]